MAETIAFEQIRYEQPAPAVARILYELGVDPNGASKIKKEAREQTPSPR